MRRWTIITVFALAGCSGILGIDDLPFETNTTEGGGGGATTNAGTGGQMQASATTTGEGGSGSSASVSTSSSSTGGGGGFPICDGGLSVATAGAASCINNESSCCPLVDGCAADPECASCFDAGDGGTCPSNSTFADLMACLNPTNCLGVCQTGLTTTSMDCNDCMEANCCPEVQACWNDDVFPKCADDCLLNTDPPAECEGEPNSNDLFFCLSNNCQMACGSF